MIVSKGDRVIVQGITGDEGRFYTKRMLDYGTNIVGGVTPGKRGCRVHKLPVFNRVDELEADASVIFVPGPEAAQAIQEAMKAGIDTIVVVTEGIPLHDFAAIDTSKATIIGPNTPGLINVGENMLGLIPYEHFKPGKVGILSRSGTLMYEAADVLSKANLGVSSAIGIGGDPIIGSDFFDLIRSFEEDERTEAVVLIGEIGGTKEEHLAKYLSGFPKPIFSYIVGKHAPPERRMGHAGAIISQGQGTYASKIESLSKISTIVEDLYGLPALINEKLSGPRPDK